MLILSPHVAGWTFESHERQVIVDKIKIKYFVTNANTVEKRVTGIEVFFLSLK
jgi:D-3-phosphoglycerate dehydrogenase